MNQHGSNSHDKIDVQALAKVITQALNAQNKQVVTQPRIRRKARWFFKLKTLFLIIAGVVVLVGVVSLLVYQQSQDRALRVADQVTGETVPNEVNPATAIGTTVDTNFDYSQLDPDTYQVPSVIHPRGLNVIFVSHKFKTFDEFKESVQFLKSSLQSHEPWKSYPDFNFYLAFTGVEDSFCQIQVQNLPRPQLRCTAKVNDYVTPLHAYRYKVVIVSRDEFMSWANMTRLNNSVVAFSLPDSSEGQNLYYKAIATEFAHGFGLRDEMAKGVISFAGSPGNSAGGPNCAQDLPTAISWWGDLVKRGGSDNIFVFGQHPSDVGFYKGCAGHSDYIKPTLGSLMSINDLSHQSDSYGAVSERYLKKVLDYCFSDKIYQVSDDPSFFAQYPEYKDCLTP